MTRASVLMVCVLLLGGVAGADVEIVTDTLDYTDNGVATEPWFIPPDIILDHSPYFRLSNQDWGWTHGVTGDVPADAIGIEMATLDILAWDVDSDQTEEDVIYAEGTALGLLEGPTREWTTTSFDLPQNALDTLWKDGELDAFIDIDRRNEGNRVTLGSSTLTVHYNVGVIPEPATIALLGAGGLLALHRRRRYRA